MNRKLLFFFLFVFSCNPFYAQEKKHPLFLGFQYGVGEQTRNSDYTCSNHYYKLQLYYVSKKYKYFQCEYVIEPEIDFIKHQLLNVFFVSSYEEDYEEKRAKYAKLKDLKKYILNIGLIVRKPITKSFSVYFMGSIGPMFIDTQTERLPDGFAFSDVLALGVSMKAGKITFDLRPNIRHTSNAGLQSYNAGFNSFNVEIGFSYPL